VIFNNPDFVEILIHSHKYRRRNAKGDPPYENLEKRLTQDSQIDVPIILQEENDGVSLPESSLAKECFLLIIMKGELLT
jgi:hypothetical protein